jgi:hypothetical protein
MRITVLTAMWGRPQVTAIMLRNLYEMRPTLAENNIELTTVVVGSEGEWSRWLVKAFDADYVPHKNKPLGAKWNAGLRRARSHNPDALVILGSDNIPNAKLFLEWAQGIKDGIEYQGILDSFVIWQPSYNRGLDWSATQKVKGMKHTERFIRILGTDIRHLGIKTKGTMSPFVASAMPKANLRKPALLVDWFGPIGQQVLDLHNW